ncbi:hypothetical protein K458DRAFT_335021 [Lentithecium fluviatile CBS 122367]|uniref:Rhodopsin domain-containing protein n=1 Tax=Lentithecium fluviatile CBS 122367 TaxID=1168545 RepID=A0A6G1J936_9PLEO|nr:hypothetical protein K458DRAFT_335021 [Lentithecium fluviatile CBS 122367]
MSDSVEIAPTEEVARHIGNVDGLRLTIGICLCFTLCFAFLRLYIRWRNYGLDDLVVLISTGFASAFFGCGFVSTQAGLGLPTDDLAPQPSTARLNQAILGSNITWILSLCLSKAAIVLTLVRTTKTRSHRICQHLTLGAIVVQCIASIAIITASCKASDNFLWDFQSNTGNCPAQPTRWRVITWLDIATEIMCLALPIQLIWNLQMAMKTKSIVAIVFWIRAPTIAFTVIRDTTTHRLTSTSDALLTSALIVVWQAIELSYSLAAVTIAALKSFAEKLNTGFGHGELVRVHGTSQSYKLSTLSANSNTVHSKGIDTAITSMDNEESVSSKVRAPERSLKLRPEFLRNSATITSHGARVVSSQGNTKQAREDVGESSEDEHVILHERHYSVRYDEAPSYPPSY